MLQCLERGERVAFVLGEIFELPSTEAAWVLDVTPAAYRKRLERARQRLRAFMNSTCGIVNDPRAAVLWPLPAARLAPAPPGTTHCGQRNWRIQPKSLPIAGEG